MAVAGPVVMSAASVSVLVAVSSWSPVAGHDAGPKLAGLDMTRLGPSAVLSTLGCCNHDHLTRKGVGNFTKSQLR